MSSTHPMFVCDSCGYARYHRLSYCPRCPGKMKLERKEIPHPSADGAIGGTNWTKLGGCASWLKKNAGLDYRDNEDREKAEMRGKLQRAEKRIEQYVKEMTPMRKALEDAGEVLTIIAIQNEFPADGLLQRITDALNFVDRKEDKLMHTVPTYWARIFCGLRESYSDKTARDSDVYQLCQHYCDQVGLCVTIERTKFCYRDGHESGVIVGLMNYPRFPKVPEEIRRLALGLAARLRVDLKQDRVSVMFPEDTVMLGDCGEETVDA